MKRLIIKKSFSLICLPVLLLTGCNKSKVEQYIKILLIYPNEERPVINEVAGIYVHTYYDNENETMIFKSGWKEYSNPDWVAVQVQLTGGYDSEEVKNNNIIEYTKIEYNGRCDISKQKTKLLDYTYSYFESRGQYYIYATGDDFDNRQLQHINDYKAGDCEYNSKASQVPVDSMFDIVVTMKLNPNRKDKWPFPIELVFQQ